METVVSFRPTHHHLPWRGGIHATLSPPLSMLKMYDSLSTYYLPLSKISLCQIGHTTVFTESRISCLMANPQTQLFHLPRTIYFTLVHIRHFLSSLPSPFVALHPKLWSFLWAHKETSKGHLIDVQATT